MHDRVGSWESNALLSAVTSSVLQVEDNDHCEPPAEVHSTTTSILLGPYWVPLLVLALLP